MGISKVTSYIVLLAVTTSTVFANLGDYRPVTKNELHVVPEWADKVPAFRYILDNLYQKYEDVLALSNKKASQNDIAQHIFGASGMTPLAVQLHERLVAPGVINSDIWSFARTPQDKQEFVKEIESIITTLRSFQAFNPTTDADNPTASILSDLLDTYAKKNSIFKKYPLHSTSLLLPLSHYILAAATLESDRFAYKRILCQVRGLWDVYEALGISERLNMVEIFTWPSDDRVKNANCSINTCPEHISYGNTDADKFLVENNEFQSAGYGTLRRSPTLQVYWSMDHCSVRERNHFNTWVDDHKQKYHGFLCIADPQMPKQLVTYSKEGDYYISNTLKDYLGALRHGTEVAFRKMVNSLDPINSHLSDCHTTPAGSVEITVIRAEISTAKGPFDKTEEDSSLPDPYVVVKVDDVEIGRTTVKENTLTPVWLEAFRADKVYSWSDVKLEVYDRDEAEKDKDDSLGGLDIELHNIVGKKESFVSTRQQFSFGRLTVAIKYNPSTN